MLKVPFLCPSGVRCFLGIFSDVLLLCLATYSLQYSGFCLALDGGANGGHINMLISCFFSCCLMFPAVGSLEKTLSGFFFQ